MLISCTLSPTDKQLIMNVYCLVKLCCTVMNDDFRFYVFTRHQLGIPPSNIHQELTIVYGDDVPTIRTVFKWVELIKNDRFELKKRVSSGRPVSTATPANIDRIRKLIQSDCRMSCSDLADELEIPKTCVYRILTDVLELRNVYSQWVLSVGTLRAARGVSLVKQSPYSPDLNLCDRYLFREIKNDLKSELYDGPEAVQKAVQHSLRLIPEIKLKDQIEKLLIHCEKVISISGDYVSEV